MYLHKILKLVKQSSVRRCKLFGKQKLAAKKLILVLKLGIFHQFFLPVLALARAWIFSKMFVSQNLDCYADTYTVHFKYCI